jgi:hypothetical protein
LVSFGAFAVLPGLRVLSGNIPRVKLTEVAHRNEGIYRLEGVAVRTDLLGTRDFRYRSKQRHKTDWILHVVVPLVEEGWSRSSPVRGWAACSTDIDGSIPLATAECLQTLRSVPERSEIAADDKYSLAVAIALEKHGLRQIDGAPILEASGSPENAWVGLVLVVLGLGLVLVMYRTFGQPERRDGAAG